jgi:phenylacetate-CoA ligase
MPASNLRLLLATRRAEQQGFAALERLRHARLGATVEFARANSPLYRRLYQGLPVRVEDPALLPVTSKKQLMPYFDDWVTDREITFEHVRKFVQNPDLIGELFMQKYTAAVTSGTTGTPGMFLLDERNRAVTNTWGFRTFGSWLDAGDIVRFFAGGRRVAAVIATGGHFTAATSTEAMRKSWLASGVRIFPAQAPLTQLVDQLNAFRPSILACYAGVSGLLAGEQEAGRLRIDPLLVLPCAETLAIPDGERIAGIFKTKVRTLYAATECLFMAVGCEHGWLHVNSDWVMLEPVDADYRPVPPGVQSHTVLVSNLANRVQPILRYDLGDSVMQRPDPCPCGNPLPAIFVRGRSADMLSFGADGGRTVTITPIAFEAVLTTIPGVAAYQIVHTTSTNLRVRMRYKEGVDADRVWDALHAGLARLLSDNGLGNVTVERASEAPAQQPSGKFRTVIPLS